MRTGSFRKQRGIALFMAVFALLLVSAIAFGFMYLTNTETQVNANYRSSQEAYFAARAGLEEARTRIRTGGDITPPTTLPSTSGGVVYMVNPASGESIQPWDKSNAYADDTICKTNYWSLGSSGALDYGSQGVACDVKSSTQFPNGSNWGGSYSSLGVWQAKTAISSSVGNSSSYAGTMYFKWVRITLKANRTSTPYIATGATSSDKYPYAVDPTLNDTDSNKMVCWDGFEQLMLPSGYTDCSTPGAGATTVYKPVYVLTSMAVTPEGSKRVISMEVANNPPVKTEGAINSQDYVTLNGQLTVDGYDYCTCSCVWVTNLDKTKTYTCTAKAPATSCGNDKYAIYSNSGVDAPNKAETITAGTDPTIAQNQTKKTDIDYLMNEYSTRSDAVDATLATPSGYATGTTGYNLTCSNGDCGTVSGAKYGIPPLLSPLTEPVPVDNPLWGSQLYQITYIPGSLHVTGGSIGNGVLVVNGDLVIDGGFQFYGLILVKGIVKFQGGGSDPTNIYGGVIAGQNSVDNTVLGGSASIKYDLCALNNDKNPQPPSVLAMHEISY
jgi:hypothetical protein